MDTNVTLEQIKNALEDAIPGSTLVAVERPDGPNWTLTSFAIQVGDFTCRFAVGPSRRPFITDVKGFPPIASKMLLIAQADAKTAGAIQDAFKASGKADIADQIDRKFRAYVTGLGLQTDRTVRSCPR